MGAPALPTNLPPDRIAAIRIVADTTEINGIEADTKLVFEDTQEVIPAPDPEPREE